MNKSFWRVSLLSTSTVYFNPFICVLLENSILGGRLLTVFRFPAFSGDFIVAYFQTRVFLTEIQVLFRFFEQLCDGNLDRKFVTKKIQNIFLSIFASLFQVKPPQLLLPSFYVCVVVIYCCLLRQILILPEFFPAFKKVKKTTQILVTRFEPADRVLKSTLRLYFCEFDFMTLTNLTARPRVELRESFRLKFLQKFHFTLTSTVFSVI